MYPTLFKIGSWNVYSYGVLTAIAFFTALYLARKKAPSAGIPQEWISDLFLVLFVTGVIGARLFYVLQHLEDFKGRIWGAFLIQEGGLVWYGGFLTAAACGFLYGVWQRWPLPKVADLIVPFLALAQAIGRVGCFLNGCCYGRKGHPVQIYEAAGALLIFGVLLWVHDRPRRRAGTVFILYIFLYSAMRFVLEFFRGDQTVVAGLTLPQWTSLVLLIGASFLYGFRRKF